MVKQDHLLCFFSWIQKSTLKILKDSRWNLWDIIFQTVRFPMRIMYHITSYLKCHILISFLFSYLSLHLFIQLPLFSSFTHFSFFLLYCALQILFSKLWVWLQILSSMFWLLMIVLLIECWLKGSSKLLLFMVFFFSTFFLSFHMIMFFWSK